MGINLNNMGISKTLWDRCRAIELKRRTAQTDKNAVGTKKIWFLSSRTAVIFPAAIVSEAPIEKTI